MTVLKIARQVTSLNESANLKVLILPLNEVIPAELYTSPVLVLGGITRKRIQ